MFLRKLLLVAVIQFSVLLRDIYAQTEPPTGSCDVPLTHDLRDDQFSASSEYDSAHNASSARFGGAGWIADDTKYQYLTVDLEDIWEITKLTFQRSDKGWFTRTFRISYSNDGYIWMPYKGPLSDDFLGEIFEEQSRSTTTELNPSLKARYVTFNPVSYNMRPSLLIELFGCHHTEAPADHSTAVNGIIEVDTTWIPSQSPILADSEIIVRPATTLTIQAGVSVIFTSETAGIQVWGALVSAGIAGLNVVLSSSYPTLTAHSRWRGVTQQTGGNLTIRNTIIQQAITGVQGNGSRVRISHCEIYSCITGIRLYGGLSDNSTDINTITDNDRMILQYVHAHKNTKGLEVVGSQSYSNIYVGYSKFDSNFENGISVVNWDTGKNDVPTHLIIVNSSISKNNQGGLRCYNQPMTMFSFKQTIFYRNSKFGVLYDESYPEGYLVNIHISDSQFIENQSGLSIILHCRYSSTCIPRQRVELNVRNSTLSKNGVAIYISFKVPDNTLLSEADFKIVANRFVSNSRDIYYLFKFDKNVHADVENNSFEQTRFPIEAIGNKLNSTMHVRNNTFTFCLSKRDSDKLINIIDIATQVVNNSFEHCSMATGIFINLCSESAFSFNSFSNSSASDCYISIGEKYDDNNAFNIDHNYWGTLDIASIKVKTCDFFLDSSKAIANLNNYFTSEALEMTKESKDIDAFRFIEDATNNLTYIGGDIDSNVDLSQLKGHGLILNKSVIVRNGVDVEIANVSIIIKRNRGIKVYGSLTIGNQNDVTEMTLEGEMSTHNKWNGINMSSTVVKLYNVTMYGMDSLIEVKGSNSTITMRNVSLTTMSMNHLIVADITNGNLSLLVEDSNISTTSTLIQVTSTDSFLGITIKGSSLNSKGIIILTKMFTSNDNLTLTKLHISRSFLISNDWGLLLEGCSSHLKAVLEDSTLSANNGYNNGISLFRSLSMDVTVIDNTFDNSKTSLKFSFCGDKSNDFTKQIDVRENIFKASRDDGIDVELTFYVEYAHIINIENNIFNGNNTLSREGIRCYGDRKTHTLTIGSNKFQHYGGTVIAIRCELNSLMLRNNTFLNNNQSLSLTDILNDGLEIVGNSFEGNIHEIGVIYLGSNNLGSLICNITDNTLEGNNGTIISLRWRNTRLRNNFFENNYAFYNLRILSDYYSDIGESINASLNYWGTSDTREISKGIYDFDFDNSLLNVEFIPYLGSKDLSDIQFIDVGFISENGEIGGNVDGNITLKLKDSPYLVISNVYVEKEDTLIIEAGVVLKIRQGVGIYIEGRFIALGNKDLPIQFIPETFNLPWRGMDIDSNLGCEIYYLRVNDTEIGIHITDPSFDIQNLTSTFSRKTGLTLTFFQNQNDNNVTLTFSHLVIENNNENGIVVSGRYDYTLKSFASLTIQDSFLSRNGISGIRITSDAGITLLNCSIFENGESGIYTSQSSRNEVMYINQSTIYSNVKYAIKGRDIIGIVMESCEVKNHTYEYYDYRNHRQSVSFIEFTASWSGKGDRYMLFLNNRFLINTADGIGIETNKFKSNVDFKDLEVRLVNNSFDGGRRSMLFRGDSYFNWLQIKVFIQNNTFKNNVLVEKTDENYQIEIGFTQKVTYHVEIKDNIVTNNTARSFLRVFNSNNIGDISISGNKLEENVFSSSLVKTQSHVPLEVNSNIFDSSNIYDCAFDVADFENGYEINATFNYWGTHLAIEVVDMVCGFCKNMSKSIVWAFPFYKNKMMSLVSASEFAMDDAFGGEVNRDLRVSKEEFNATITIYRSIIIRKRTQLFIGPAINLIFAPNRGIYVQGSLSIDGRNLETVLDTIEKNSQWYGIVVNTSPFNETERVEISSAIIQNMRHGIVVYSPVVKIKGSIIANSTTNCLTLFDTRSSVLYDFDNTIFTLCGDVGIDMKDGGAVTLVNANISESSIGIKSNKQNDLLEIRSCSISNCAVGISVTSQTYDTNSSINIVKNHFRRTPSKALLLKFRYGKISTDDTQRTIRVDFNTFEDVCGIDFQTWDHDMTSFRDNDLKNSMCLDNNDCFMAVFANGGSTFYRERQIDISSNRFENISAKCIIQFADNEQVALKSGFTFNTVRDNKGSDGVIVANGRNFNISENVFVNADSIFDVITTLKGAKSVNVTKNWWGSSDLIHVLRRIFDQRRNPDLIRFEIEPILDSGSFDCIDVNNCSSHGECINRDKCRCTSGWIGNSCQDFDCRDVNNCYGNGECTGPNTCSCFDGWSGSQCITASCSKVNNCSGHGFCVEPNMCVCAERFTENDCNSCEHNHGGPTCETCPECKNGFCDSQTGLCECDGKNWAGYLCDRCNVAFYGAECLPLMKVLEIVPNRGQEKGGSDVHVWGHNFPETGNSAYKCRFGSIETNGKWLAWNHVVCTSSRQPEGEVTVEISPNGTDFTNDGLTYYYYSSCPIGSCGRNMTPPRGQCLFGTCSCYLPWKGDNCMNEILPPVIEDVPNVQTVNESQTYIHQLQLKQGDLPVRWSLKHGPRGMSIDEMTGLVKWSNTLANTEPYHIEVSASNILKEVSIKWNLMVTLSYTTSVESLDPSDSILPFPRSIKIFGNVDFMQKTSPRIVPVQVIVLSISTEHETVIDVSSDASSPNTFTAIYIPRPDDAGLFTVSSRHPGKTSMTPTPIITWSVLGMKCEPYEVFIDEIISPDETSLIISRISTLVNVGANVINDVSGKIDGLPDAIIRKYGDSNDTSFYVQKLNINESIFFDLVITNAKPLFGYINIFFTSSQGTFASMNVNIKLSVKKPVLVLEPSSLRKNILRWSIKVLDINITNIGDVSATDVSVSLPGDSRFSLVSFTTENHWLNESSDESNVNILPNGNALLSIAILIGESDSLGELKGNIYINSLLTTNALPFTVFITSTRTLNVSFIVKDEYTYFANGSPLVTNARITLSNPRRIFSQTKYTENGTGIAVFEDIFEDQYTINAEANNHSSYDDVILISPSKTNYDIFLQRIAVTYTWTVESTTIKDVYNIALESTFETYVPMPVVTVEPSHIDTLPFEQIETGLIEFVVTNHGLIQANNVRFALPTSHPYLTFTSTVDNIGTIAANTSIVVPVKTMRNQRERRSSGSVCVDVLLYYDYQCGGTRTAYALVRISRGNGGRSCGRAIYPMGDGSSNGGGSGGHIAFVGYVSGSTLTCDCLSTLLQSCYLSFIPRVGCGLALKDFYFLARSNAGVKDVVVGITDILFGCFAPPIISELYTALRCIQNANDKCSGGDRNRREINSDIVNAVIQTSKPMLDFINMGHDIYGTNLMSIEDAWYTEFKKSVSDDTQLGSMISWTESSAIIDNVSDKGNKSDVSRFIDRYNNTVAAWENGTLTQLEETGRVISFKLLQANVYQFVADNDESKAKGYDSIFGAYEQSVQAYNEAKERERNSQTEQKEGVCARVRIRIEQELVLTREAFKAKLEIENGEKTDLENIKVEIKITQTFGSEVRQNDKFSIGKLTLIGISSVDGEGRLERGLSGSAEWLIIPYSNAAPEDATEYDVGGQFSYTVDGTEFSVSLLPDTILVSPNPSLIVHYFHEKYVRGDDALTPEIEPIVPFSLAVMITNSGYGVARALKITSGQPEIIENEKGLLVSFKIIAAQLGNKSIAPSLTVDFGDIQSFETKTARWLMTSTLMGKFFNYSATFENINPLGDPQLSLIDKLEYHDLIHLVRSQSRGMDDGLDDFLVNNFPDQDSFPDMLYDSANGSSVSKVFNANVTDHQWKTFTSSSMKVYKQVNLTVSVNTTLWFYTRTENTFTRENIFGSKDLLYAETQYGRTILLEKNVWQTTHILDTFFVHLFDYIEPDKETNDLEEKEIIYILTYGPRNNYAPTVKASTYSINVTKEENVGDDLAIITASDNDRDNVQFELRQNDSFAIKQLTTFSVAVVLKERIPTPGKTVLELVVKDDGIPAKYTSINIDVIIAGGQIDNNTSDTTTLHTTMKPSSTKSYEPDSSTDGQGDNKTTSLDTDNGTDDTLTLVIPLIIGGVILLALIIGGCVYIIRRNGTISRSNVFELN